MSNIQLEKAGAISFAFCIEASFDGPLHARVPAPASLILFVLR